MAIVFWICSEYNFKLRKKFTHVTNGVYGQNELLIHATTWMNLRTMIPRGQAKKEYMLYDFIYIKIWDATSYMVTQIRSEVSMDREGHETDF